LVMGRDAIDYLAQYFPIGTTPSRRKLYRVIPGFSAKSVYPKQFLVEALIA
jgi:hypothetical protein